MNILEFESFAWYIPFLGPRFFSALFIASESASAQFFFWHLFLFQVLRGLDILKLVNVLRGLDILKLQLYVLHNSDIISFPLFRSRFLRYNKHQSVVKET